MEITNIKRFSEVYNNLREYFNKIEACTYQQEPLFPILTGPLIIKKGFIANNWDVPCSSDTFERLYNEFSKELGEIYENEYYHQDTVIAMLEAYFGNVNCVFENSLIDVFKYGREDLVKLIEMFNDATGVIYDIINENKQMSESQVPKELYTNKKVEECIEKMFENGNIKTIVNETIRDFDNEVAIQSIQRQAITSTKGNKIQQTFRDIIQSDDKEKLLKRLHYLIDGKGGAAVGAILLKTYLDHHLTQIPTQGMYESEFELIGTWKAIHNYMSENKLSALDKANKITIFD